MRELKFREVTSLAWSYTARLSRTRIPAGSVAPWSYEPTPPGNGLWTLSTETEVGAPGYKGRAGQMARHRKAAAPKP